ncbi:MAG TPA: 2TM domain-containing protein [Actinomycetota bacterium]|nr:2TM domain-containing protein [Actinomycetota bacterium]
MSDAFDRAVEREQSERRRWRYRGAWKRFGVHLRVYLFVNLLLAAIWAAEAVVDGGHPFWPVHALWGWGIGLVVHYLVVTRVTGRWRPRRGHPSTTTQIS